MMKSITGLLLKVSLAKNNETGLYALLLGAPEIDRS
jgi:hypothetical protein